jgi:tRNA(Phe) wybutosine-synthesizing methylase Tyw3
LIEISQLETQKLESKLPMAAHPQRWIKVNAPVDEGVAEIVSLLNSIEGLQTLQSCQGDPGERDGYVWFTCGEWKQLTQVVFERIGPVLKRQLDEDAILIIEATNADEPMAKLSFRAEASGMVVSALKDVLR